MVSTSDKTRIADRRQRISELYLHGNSMPDIARMEGVDTATISRDLKELRKEWLERSVNHIDAKKAIELAKLDALEATYWVAWENSLKSIETEITEQIGSRRKVKAEPGAEGQEAIVPDKIRKTKRVEGKSGDPQFLHGILNCIAKRCDILGIDAPKKQENLNIDLSTLDDDQLQRIQNGEDITRVLKRNSG